MNMRLTANGLVLIVDDDLGTICSSSEHIAWLRFAARKALAAREKEQENELSTGIHNHGLIRSFGLSRFVECPPET